MLAIRFRAVAAAATFGAALLALAAPASYAQIPAAEVTIGQTLMCWVTG